MNLFQNQTTIDADQQDLGYNRQESATPNDSEREVSSMKMIMFNERVFFLEIIAIDNSKAETGRT